MYRRPTLCVVALALCCASHALSGTITWDNYPGDVFDAELATTSERNTSILDATWSVDDVDWTQPEPGRDASDLRITSLEWVGVRKNNVTYSTAEVIILDTNLENPFETGALAYSSILVEPDPHPSAEFDTYTGSITFDVPLTVPTEHFYIGVRLVSDVPNQGRNFFATHSGDVSFQGQTGGFVKAPIFGAHDWTAADDFYYGFPGSPLNFEYAFRLEGLVIPEPASMLVLLIGGLAALRRR